MQSVRVLVVDDNEDSAETLATLFDLIGCETLTEYDGRAGLATVRNFRPAVCVLDIHMPGLDGCHLAKAIRAEFEDKVKLVAVTGVAGGEYDERIRDAQFDARFTKPADFDLLLRTLETAENPD